MIVTIERSPTVVVTAGALSENSCGEAKAFALRQDAVDKWLENADFDSDGRISIEEFKLSVAGNSLVDDV
jgi:Ca2+-binding EF-hand superfamily protein